MVIFPTSLIFSSTQDAHVRAVVAKFGSEGIPFVCDFSEFGKSMAGTLRPDTSMVTILLSSGTEVSCENVKTIWWRRPQSFTAPRRLDPGVGHYVQEEAYRFWDSALALLGQRNIAWYNHCDLNRAADRKTFQLAKAASSGICVPRTIVTSSSEEAIEFVAKNGSVIFKSFSGNECFWQPTRLFTDGMRSKLAMLHSCPIILQEFIDGPWDYRVTIVDDWVQAVRFDVRKSRYKYDVRIDTKSVAEACRLDSDTEGRLLRMIKSLGLRYASIDLRERENGDVVFFEVNPAGQFLYLDQLAGTNIVGAMAEALSASGANQEVDVMTQRVMRGFESSEEDRPFAQAVECNVVHLD